MNHHLKTVYDRAPFLRPVLASAYGTLLQRSRYSRETEDEVRAAHEREAWPPERWRAWQDERLELLLDRAATRVPYYRRLWQERRRQGDTSSWRVLENWPVLRKDHLRTHPEDFLAEDAPRGSLTKLSTSGSTGTPVTVWRDRATTRSWYSLFEARWRRWNGVDLRDPWGMLGGKIVVPTSQERPPYWVWNAGMRQLYMSTFHLKPANVAAYLEALRRHGIVYLYGYASSLYALSWMALEQGLEAPPMKVVLSNAEPLHDHHREAIGRLFGCPVRDTYGMVEAVAAASECEHGDLHLWPDAGRVEVFADQEDTPVPWGHEGRLICTGLLNEKMPLIRYEVGDRGVLAPPDEPCACGRRLPRVYQITGRMSDNIVTADGRRIFQMDHVFYALGVREAQIIQESLDRLQVKVVPGETFSQRDEEAIRSRLRERVGEIAVDIDSVPAIPRGANGKFRAVVNALATQ